jgi:hypothetical protein
MFGHVAGSREERGEAFLFYSYTHISGGALLVGLCAGGWMGWMGWLGWVGGRRAGKRSGRSWLSQLKSWGGCPAGSAGDSSGACLVLASHQGALMPPLFSGAAPHTSALQARRQTSLSSGLLPRRGSE